VTLNCPICEREVPAGGACQCNPHMLLWPLWMRKTVSERLGVEVPRKPPGRAA
jgi:hypothetical protein